MLASQRVHVTHWVRRTAEQLCLNRKITHSMIQQLLVTIPQFLPFAFTMILMISDMEIDIHTLGSTNRSPQLNFACVRNLYDVLTIDNP